MKYSEEDLATLRKMFENYERVEEIAQALKRSPESVAQKIYQLKLRRSNHLVRMVRLHGKKILSYGSTPAEIKRNMRIECVSAREEKRKQAIVNLKKNLKKKMPRNDAIRLAAKEGAKLVTIGEVIGMTKQGVSQIVKPPKKKVPSWL